MYAVYIHWKGRCHINLRLAEVASKTLPSRAHSSKAVHRFVSEMASNAIIDGLKAALSPNAVVYFIGLYIAYHIAIALYNISPFHPLARFPGPKIAAASYLYEAYFDWWLLGRYGKVIARMHEHYGRSNESPSLRHNPLLTNINHRAHCQN